MERCQRFSASSGRPLLPSPNTGNSYASCFMLFKSDACVQVRAGACRGRWGLGTPSTAPLSHSRSCTSHAAPPGLDKLFGSEGTCFGCLTAYHVWPGFRTHLLCTYTTTAVKQPYTAVQAYLVCESRRGRPICFWKETRLFMLEQLTLCRAVQQVGQLSS